MTHGPEGSSYRTESSWGLSSTETAYGNTEANASQGVNAKQMKRVDSNESSGSSSYSASHENGLFGATGGGYSSSDTRQSGGGLSISYSTSGPDLSRSETYDSTYSQGSSITDKGTYWDLGPFRFETGTLKSEGEPQSTAGASWTDVLYGEEWTFEGETSDYSESESTTDYSPFGYSGTSHSESGSGTHLNDTYDDGQSSSTSNYATASVTKDGEARGYISGQLVVTPDPNGQSGSYYASFPDNGGQQQAAEAQANNAATPGVAPNGRHNNVETGSVTAPVGGGSYGVTLG